MTNKLATVKKKKTHTHTQNKSKPTDPNSPIRTAHDLVQWYTQDSTEQFY